MVIEVSPFTLFYSSALSVNGRLAYRDWRSANRSFVNNRSLAFKRTVYNNPSRKELSRVWHGV